MFPIGLSIFVHLFILLLSFLKKLLDHVLLRMKWDLLKVKLSLFLRLKIGVPLTNRAGDSIFRRSFALMIFFTVVVSIMMTLLFIGPRLKTNSNLEFVAGLLKSNQTLASQDGTMILYSDGIMTVPPAFLPVSKDIGRPAQY